MVRAYIHILRKYKKDSLSLDKKMSSKVIINDKRDIDVSSKHRESETFTSQRGLFRWCTFAIIVCWKKKWEILTFWSPWATEQNFV